MIDQTDLDSLMACAGGPALHALPEPCAAADLDGDSDVDQTDFGLLQACAGRDLRPSTVFITEIMAEDNRVLPDDEGDHPDWIELYNAGGDVVDLAGWYLTDDAGKPAKWRFPTWLLEPGQHRVVFASGEDRVGFDGELHAGFQLDQAGEYLALVKPDGLTVASAFAPAFPRQKARVSYGPRGETAPGTTQLLAPGAVVRYLVPPADLGLTWTEPEFPDGHWATAQTGVGYERSSAGTYDPLIGAGGDVESLIYNTPNFTIYLRIPFTVEAPAAVTRLALKMKYDDAFVAYLNGELVARTPNAADPPAWNSRAKSGHDANPSVYDEFDITAAAGALRVGSNVLAIHGMNFSSNVMDLSSDFIFMPELWIEAPSAGAYHFDDLRFFAAPTPGAPNGSGSIGYVTDTKFSVNRGFFQGPFSVGISTETPGATIRYTTDGSTPTAGTGMVYAGEVPITTTTTLRAAAFKPDHLPTNVDTLTYLFPADVPLQPVLPEGFPATWGGANGSNLIAGDYEVDPDVTTDPAYSGQLVDALTALPTLSLVSEVTHFFDRNTGFYSNKLREGVAWERPVSAELIYFDGRPGFQVDCGIRIQGGTSVDNSGSGWKCNKLSMRLLFKDIYGPPKLDFPLFPDSGVTSFNTLVLDAHMNYTWHYNGGVDPDAQRGQAQYVRDSFAADLHNALGSLAPHHVFAHVYINGLYWGVHEIHERADEDFSADYLGGEPDEYDILKHDANTVMNGDNTAYLQMMSLAAGGLAADGPYQDLIQNHLDVDSFIDYMIANFYIGNTDWAHHNWYVSRRRAPGGLFRYFSWDAEHVLKNAGDNVTGKNDAGGPTYLHQQLRANAEYQLRFADHVHRHFFNGGALYVDAASPAWDPARPDRNRPAALYMKNIAEIETAIIMESARWGDAAPARANQPYTRDLEWANELNRLLTQWFPQRSANVLQQLRNTGLYPTPAAPAYGQHGGAYPAGFQLTMTAPGTIRYTLDGSDPRLSGGAVSPTAVVYAGPVALAGTVRVKARTHTGNAWSALAEALFAPAAVPALRITEVMYHPPSGGTFGDDEYEFIELKNVGEVPLELDGVSLGGGIQFTFPAMELAAGAFVVVVENQTAFGERYGPAATVAGQYTGNLKNSSDLVRLSDALGQIILEFSYFDTWYPSTDGQGFSLCILDPLGALPTWADAGSWGPSTAILGSPGAVNP